MAQPNPISSEQSGRVDNDAMLGYLLGAPPKREPEEEEKKPEPTPGPTPAKELEHQSVPTPALVQEKPEPEPEAEPVVIPKAQPAPSSTEPSARADHTHMLGMLFNIKPKQEPKPEEPVAVAARHSESEAESTPGVTPAASDMRAPSWSGSDSTDVMVNSATDQSQQAMVKKHHFRANVSDFLHKMMDTAKASLTKSSMKGSESMENLNRSISNLKLKFPHSAPPAEYLNSITGTIVGEYIENPAKFTQVPNETMFAGERKTFRAYTHQYTNEAVISYEELGYGHWFTQPKGPRAIPAGWGPALTA